MSEDTTQPQGETEAEYYERVKSVPGFFSDNAESGHDVVTKAKRLLQEAEHLFSHSTLAPNPHGETPEEPTEAVEEPEDEDPESDEPEADPETETEPQAELTPEPVEEPVPDPEPEVTPEVSPDPEPVAPEEPAV